MQSPPLRILLVEDVEVVREALAALLNSHPDLHVVAQLGRGDVIVPVAVRSRPDVAVIDADLAGVDGLSAAIMLHQQDPDCPTLILSGVDRPGAGDGADAGVSGLLLHTAPIRLEGSPSYHWRIEVAPVLDGPVPEAVGAAAGDVTASVPEGN